MTQVRAAALAQDFRALHTVAGIRFGSYAIFFLWRMKTGPTRARVKLRLRMKQLLLTTHTVIHARLFMVPIFTRERRFSALIPTHLKLRGRKLVLVFFFGFDF